MLQTAESSGCVGPRTHPIRQHPTGGAGAAAQPPPFPPPDQLRGQAHNRGLPRTEKSLPSRKWVSNTTFTKTCPKRKEKQGVDNKGIKPMNSASRPRIPSLSPWKSSPGGEGATSAAVQNPYSAGKPGRAGRSRVSADTERGRTLSACSWRAPLAVG